MVCTYNNAITIDFKGTGKSITGAHIAYVFAKVNKLLNTPEVHKCVLYCGPSNKSVDVVFGKYYVCAA